MMSLFFCERVINSFFKMKELLSSNYILLFNLPLWEERLEKASKNKLKSNFTLETSSNDCKITYSIISRGEMIINYRNKNKNISIRVTGELIIEPPIFYADLIILEKSVDFTDDEKREILNFIANDSEKSIGTKIIFD